MAHHRVLQRDPVGPKDRTRHPADLHRLGDVVQLAHADLVGAQPLAVLEPAEAECEKHAVGQLDRHLGQLVLGQLEGGDGTTELLPLHAVGQGCLESGSGRTHGAPDDAVASLVQAGQRPFEAAHLADPQVLELVCPARGAGIGIDALIAPDREGPATLYVVCEGGSAASTAPLATALISAIVRAGRRASQHCHEGRLDPVCTFVLDEAPNVAPIPEMPLLISDGGGRGMPAWVFAQSFGQLRARWGRDEADTMWGSAPIKLVLGGASETDDLERLSRLMGERRVRRVSTSRSGSGWSRQTSTERERVLPVEQIRQLDVGQALLLYRSLPPAIVDLTPWWQRRDAKAFGTQLPSNPNRTAGTE